MRKKIALTGLVLFVIGILLIAAFFLTGFALPQTSRTVNQVSSGEWESGLIEASPNVTLAVVTGTSSNYGLIPASDLISVNSTNLASYAVKPVSSTDVDSHLALAYRDLNGPYYFVEYSSSAPTISVTFVSNSDFSAGHGLLILAGGVLAFIGFIVGIVGAVLRKKTA